jgi:hypothetical protein
MKTKEYLIVNENQEVIGRIRLEKKSIKIISDIFYIYCKYTLEEILTIK